MLGQRRRIIFSSTVSELSISRSMPYYWFSHNTMRDRLRIPHYLIGNLVRYRMSELAIWAAHCNTVQNHNAEYSGGEGTS